MASTTSSPPLAQPHETLRHSQLPILSPSLSPASMAKILISLSSPPFVGAPLLSLSRHGPYLPSRKLLTSRVRVNLHDIPPIHSFDSALDFNAIATRAESLLYTLADAAVSADAASGASTDAAAAAAAAQKNGGWFGFISESMEFVLKVFRISLLCLPLRDGYLSG